jgi:Ca2+-binding EF-hand superfamily protein/mono/diheme cytochrome c family protein
MKRLLSLTLFLTLAGLSASAQTPGDGVFQKFDKNADGKVTTEELPNPKAFARFDTNQDGAIILEEYEAVTGGTTPTPPTPPATPMKPGETSPGASPPTIPADSVFSGYDKNSDSKVTTEELPNPRAFERYDLDKDGAISLAEYNQVSGKTSPTTPGTPTTPATPAASGGMASQIENIIKTVDKNVDGRITKEEAGDAPWFARVDQNADGVIDATELETVRKMAARGAGGGIQANAPTITPEEVAEVTSGPEVLKPGDVGIGRLIDDLSGTTLDGQGGSLGDFKDHKGLVILMTSATCPVSKRYIPSVAKLEKELAAQDMALLLVNPFASETAEEIKAQLAEAGITAAYVHDKEKKLTAALGACTTTEVFLLDAKRTLVYRGAFDDQYGVNYNLDAPRHRYLHDAIAALSKGETPEIQATAAPGCELDLGDAPTLSASPVTYHRDVARILQQNCVQCHRQDGIAPFALDDLAEVTDRARVIKRVVSEGTMPPWFAVLEPGAETNPWANDCSLSVRDKTDLIAWIDSKDRPLGDPADSPAPRLYPEEWSIGTPDLVVPLSRAYDIKADGFMPYAFDVVQTELPEDRWVKSYEILPSERDVVHHVIVQVHEKGETATKRDEGTGGYWAIYVPGNGAHTYPEGFARQIPAGAKISFQIHYTPSGKAKKERLRLGLVFAAETPKYEVKTVGIAHQGISIPPGAERHVETKTQRIPFDMPLTSFMPHMHIRGAAFKYEVTFPDGKSETLLDIPRYDFNWQLRYDYKQPRLIPRGSTMKITAIFNNSASNRANPDPTKLVKWGSQTVDEMMLGYVEYFLPVAAAAKVAAK